MSGPATAAPEAGVPDVVAPPPHHPRFPLTVGLRGVPAIAIIVGHAWFFSGGFGGFTESLPNRLMVRMDGLVALFFLLSAFLLYRPMIAHRTGGGAAPRTADYARRRFLRLYPAYWVAITLIAIFPGLIGVWSGHWWAFYSLTDFLDLHAFHSACPASEEFRCGLPQSWTLGVDMTFYVALPFYAALAALIARGRAVGSWMRLELALLALLAAASLILGGPPLNLRQHDWFHYSAAGHFYWFALGLAIAVLSVAYKREDPPKILRLVADHPGSFWVAAGCIYVFTLIPYPAAPFIIAPFTNAQYVSLNLIEGIFAVLLFLPAVFANPNRGTPARVLGHPSLMWVGLISYGLLLWNTTFAAILGYPEEGYGYWTVLIGGVLIALPLATVSYYLVERPLMKLKYRPFRQVLEERRRRKAGTVPQPGSTT